MASSERVELAGGRAVLYRGDCRELLAAGMLKADAIVMDPPYGIGYQHGGNGVGDSVDSKATVHNIGAMIGDDEQFDPIPWIAHAAKANRTRLLGRQPRIVIFGAENFMQRLPAGGTLLAWDKHVGYGPDDSFTDCEWAWCGKKVKREVFRWLWKGIVAQKHVDDMPPPAIKGGKGYGAAKFARVHTSQKPVELMRWCIDKVKPPPDGVILDPYMGSGSTGIAALSRGNRFIGVEFDPAHFATACARIEKAALEMGLT